MTHEGLRVLHLDVELHIQHLERTLQKCEDEALRVRLGRVITLLELTLVSIRRLQDGPPVDGETV